MMEGEGGGHDAAYLNPATVEVAHNLKDVWKPRPSRERCDGRPQSKSTNITDLPVPQSRRSRNTPCQNFYLRRSVAEEPQPFSRQ